MRAELVIDVCIALSCARRCALAAVTASLRRPRYNGKYLHGKIRSMLGETRLSDALTDVVIPTFDVKLLQPIIFSTYDVCQFYMYKRTNVMIR